MLSKKRLVKNILLYSPVGLWKDSIQNVLGYKKGKFTNIFNPCNKCLVKPICSQHYSCDKYQNWYFKKAFCDHNWEVDRLLMSLPTSLMYQCNKCRKIK